LSLAASEARDCFQEGPGLPPKWPYRLNRLIAQALTA
jgi:hypothetical protein